MKDRSFPEPVIDQRNNVDEPFDELGTLKAEKYGFAAVLRTEDCAVVGVGCAPADLSDRLESVSIPVRGVFPPEGACPGECSRGLCDE